MTISSKVYGNPDQEQIVKVEIDYYSVPKFFGSKSMYFVNYVEVLDAIEFKPKFLKEDLEQSIAEHFGIEVEEVKIECDIQVKIITPVLV